jgi:hypothetical protein
MMLSSPTQTVNPFAARRVHGYGTGMGGEEEPTATPPTIAPVLAVTAAFGGNTSSLSWSASNKTSSPGFYYDIELDIDGAGYSSITTTTSLTYSDSRSLAAGETYSYRVIPNNDYGVGPTSNTVAIVLPGKPNGPELLGPDNTSNPQFAFDDFTLTWSAVTGAATYDVYKSTTDSGYTLWQSGIANTFLDVSLSSAFGVGNWWYVIANNGSAFYSEESNHLQCTPLLSTGTNRSTEDSVSRTLENNENRILEG